MYNVIYWLVIIELFTIKCCSYMKYKTINSSLKIISILFTQYFPTKPIPTINNLHSYKII